MSDQRLLSAQRERLRTIEGSSSILTVEAEGLAPPRYTLRFRGRGLCRDAATGSLTLTDEHECDLRLPYDFPRRGPDIQWLTPLLHPNISFSGLVQLEDLGLPWNSRMGLEVVCERLWDAARLAYVDWHRVVNQSAAHSLQHECAWALPLDLRPLRDRDRRHVINLVRYRHAAEQHTGPRPETPGRELLIIDEQSAAEESAETRPATASDNEIFYIGDEPSPAD